MDIKLITIQVARNDNRTIGYGYDASLYASEDALFENMKNEFENGFGEDVEYASLTYKLNDGTVNMFLLDTDLSGEELVNSIKESITG